MLGDLLPWSLGPVSLKQVDSSIPGKYLYAWGSATLELGAWSLKQVDNSSPTWIFNGRDSRGMCLVRAS